MRHIFALTIILLISISCGERQIKLLDQGTIDRVPLSDAHSTPLAENDCTLKTFGEDHILECKNLTVLIEGNILSRVQDNEDELIMVASKRNNDGGEDQWVDTEYELEAPTTLLLPQNIPATGETGSDHKIYIRFNDNIDCVWISNAQSDYTNYQCYQSALRAPELSSGFSEGEPIELTEIENVSKVQMHLNGAQDNELITTATAVLLKI